MAADGNMGTREERKGPEESSLADMSIITNRHRAMLILRCGVLLHYPQHASNNGNCGNPLRVLCASV